MNLKRISKLTALLLAFILCFSTVAEAAVPLSDFTTYGLLDGVLEALGIKRVYGCLNYPLTLTFDKSLDEGEYTYQWKKLTGFNSSENVVSDETPSQLTIKPGTSTEYYYCSATNTSTGTTTYSSAFIVKAYGPNDAVKYLEVLSHIRSDVYPGEKMSYRVEAHKYMTQAWNTTMDSQNLAQAILTASTTSTEYTKLLCTCCIAADGSISDEILLHPYVAHQKGCPWEDYIITLPLPPQPPLYYGKPMGAQYPSNPTYNLPMVRAVILPEGGSATVTVSGSAVSAQTRGVTSSTQWQVYNGSEWANILGETSDTLVVTTAKLQTIFNLTGVAHLRYYDKANSIVLASVDVTSQAIAGGEYPEETTQTISVETREGVNNETQTTYNVVVNYLFENNEIVADPYTASLAAGSSFSAKVTFPTVQGYLPYLNDVQQNSHDLSYTAIDQDYTYNVVYKPTNVDYTVVHYKQNLNDDNYTEAERETKQGLTNSQVSDDLAKKTYEGFYALLYEKPQIAADGSTVIEIYYDRYYYLMNFDLDGGYGVEPIYARYGAPIGDVGTPTKAGYSFQGWNPTVPKTVPVDGGTYKAVWQAGDTAKVTVVFWGENADDEAYSYIRSMQVDAKPDKSYTFDGSSMTCPLEEHSHAEEGCTLACTHPEHTEECYRSEYGLVETELPQNANPNPAENGIWTYTTGRWNPTTHYYLELNGKWYCGTDWWGNADDTQRITFNCKHTHTDECYSCGKIEHAHGSACSGLWTFKESDTVTVAADGSSVVNVYYDRVEYDVRFYSRDNGNPEYQKLKITAKWGASILDKWPTVDGSSSWYVASSGDTWQNSIQIMPVGGAKFYGPKKGSSSYKAYYYVEVLPGEEGEDHNGVTYKLHHTDVSSSSGNVTDEERYEIKGFTYKEGTSNGTSYNNAKFYYTRNSYKLTFNDGYNDVKEETVLYEAPLSTYKDYVPAVPSAYEPGSVTFGGWYLNPECTGAEYKLDENKMPADNVLLYAKWVPVSHKVEFYLDADALEAGNKLSTHPDITVPHGSKADPTPAKPTNGSYTFVGWFYMDNGVEKAFDFANMPVNKNLQVYGKWSSNVLKQYTIYYKAKVINTETGLEEEVEIAAPTTGSGLAGITKTFEAKGGTDLYADYQEGYFPVTKSHSMTIDIEDESKNTFTFWYVQKDAVPYTVKYLDKETGLPVATEKTVSNNRKAVVTETFVPVTGMMPDAYQKRLVVSAEEGAVNEIIFYYTEDTTHAYYKITHYTENGESGWTEYASSQAVGDIGTTYTADPMTIPGFSYDSTVDGTVVSGKLTADGLELKLYYTRNSYPYQVRYLEQGTGKQLADPKDSTGKYGQVISESAIDIDNYTAVDPTSQTLNIRIEESTEAKLNIITFYYTENEATINYVVVGPDGCGTVSPTSETLKVLTGTAQGSTATANAPTYRFVGWYTDADCTKPVDASWVDANNKITPPKQDSDNDATTAPVYVAATYYAKFEYNLTSLTITKDGDEVKGNENFIFKVTVGSDQTFIVTINGKGSVTIGNLEVGKTVTITEDGNWSNRYKKTEYSSKTLVLDPDATKNTITVKNSDRDDHWLHDESSVENFKQTPSNTGN